MASSHKYLLTLLLLHLSSHVVSDDKFSSSYEVLLSWNVVDFKWPSQITREWFISTNQYIPENNVITGFKVRGSKIFLALPRLKRGVPSTLNVVDVHQKMGQELEEPLLVPYPNWDMQQVGNCDAFQYVQSMEIDRWGRMWVIDVGSVNLLENRTVNCRTKIVLLDLERDEVIHKYEFPEDVVSPQTNSLNDLVVDCDDEHDQESCYAYITDTRDSKLVVYNFRDDRSWYVTHPSMRIDPEAVKVNVLGRNYTANSNINGIALSPRSSNHDRVYYSAISSYSLYSIPTSILKDAKNGVTLRDRDVITPIKRRSSQSDGLAMDENGVLFYGRLQNNSVVYVDTTAGSRENLVVRNDEDLQWPAAFAFDDQGYLYMLTNRYHCFTKNTCDRSTTNTRVSRVFVGSRSYQYSKEDRERSVSVQRSGKPNLNFNIKEAKGHSLRMFRPKAGWSQ